MSFSGLKDIEEQSAFNRFVVGEKQDVKVDKPYGIAIYDGKIYVCDTNNSVDGLRSEAQDLWHPEGRGRSGAAQATAQHQHRSGRHQVRDRPGPRPGRRVRSQRRVRESLRRRPGPGGRWMRCRSTTGSTSPTSAMGWSRSSTSRAASCSRRSATRATPSERLDRPTNLAFDREGLPLRHRRREVPGRQVRPRRSLQDDLRAGRETTSGTSRGRRGSRSIATTVSTRSMPPSTTCRSSTRKDAC